MNASIRRMTRAMKRRGPDDEGYFVDAESALAMGHRRLSVVDLSPEGRQPMTSKSERYVLTFNGEIYNHHRLRLELASASAEFRGHSDTEVALAAIQNWGLEQAIERFIGMFAFALWDRRDRTLTLVRDRLGIKPLYFGWMGRVFVFASELKAFCALPEFANDVNRDGLALMLRHSYVPAPYSIYEGVYKLMPGTLLEVDSKVASCPCGPVELTRRARTFWSARDVVESSSERRFAGTATDAVNELESLLEDAVRLRMEADVPLGAFLSGGVDSSTVVALMQTRSVRPVRTFAIGFEQRAYNEAEHARAVARRLGTDHTELYVTAREALAVIPDLPEVYDEPFADSSQIPTLLISRLTRSHVTVSLSGDGGDELFAGYNRYHWSRRIWTAMRCLPAWPRRVLARTLRGAPEFWGAGLASVMRLLPKDYRVGDPRDKIGRLAGLLELQSFDQFYTLLVSHWQDPEAVVLNSAELPTALTDPARQSALSNEIERMMFADLVSYLPDDILTKVDRATMAASLEARVPLLDHRVVEFAARLPLDLKIRDGLTKWPLRQVLYRRVPRELIERPKMGFGVPLASWLRGPLRDWAESLLDQRRLRNEGYLDAALVRRTWNDHLNGRSNDQYRIWTILMVQAWMECWQRNRGSVLAVEHEGSAA